MLKENNRKVNEQDRNFSEKSLPMESSSSDLDHREEDFSRQFAEHQRLLFGYLVTLLGDPSAAEDVFQETCVVLLRERENYQPGSKFVGWATTIAYNQVRRYRRERTQRRRMIGGDLLALIADEASTRSDENVLRREALTDCLSKLKDEDRRLVRTAYGESTSLKSAAEKLSRPVNTVYKSLNRIRGKLYDCIQRALSSEKLR